MSETILGDLPNQLGKRGCSDCSDVDVVAKRVCISPSRGNWTSSKDGNVVASSISNISNENKDGDLLEFGCREGSKASADIGTDCSTGGCSRGKSVMNWNSTVPVGVNDIMVMDHKGGADVSVNVNDMDKVTIQENEGSNLTELVGARAINSISPKALKEIRAIAEILCENSSGSGGEVLMDSSEKCKGKDNVSLMYLDRGDTFESADFEAEFGNSLPAVTPRTVSKTDGNFPHDRNDFDGYESKASAEGTPANIISFQNDGDNLNTDDLFLSQCGPFSCTSPPESQEYIEHGLEKSKELKEGDICALSESTDSMKACSCSFCTKAAYIWLDLNYQDVKGRVSALRKIQKEANILSERSIRSNVIFEQGIESSNQISKFVPEFMYQWRPLFASMANEWKEEGTQLEARLQTLTSLREKCKTEMELMYGTTSEKH